MQYLNIAKLRNKISDLQIEYNSCESDTRYADFLMQRIAILYDIISCFEEKIY